MSVHSLMVGRLMLVLILAQATTDLLADDECLDDVCALHALQTKAHLQQAVEGDAERVAELKEKLPSCVTVTEELATSGTALQAVDLQFAKAGVACVLQASALMATSAHQLQLQLRCQEQLKIHIAQEVQELEITGDRPR
eukprot:CAMPEP_0197660200 /NCGR_PEP_ID=MMETSP1338-20131121/50706_1 /TAXON_ID=43686 ORGANISM="Pelagodinium beii, Strain RCC1491" /NCGR_SAMPLE_ID=MMETSP1338 /ASSEMBLY_ACC=CAM_ASM_000754 /LENGTH=139 /DNA_ID=CAMNT_0043237507 /DNA_START=75 /DNA_END=492 /DNA_ORIENTATION=+